MSMHIVLCLHGVKKQDSNDKGLTKNGEDSPVQSVSQARGITGTRNRNRNVHGMSRK